MDTGNIAWHIIGLPSKKSQLWERGYRGGIVIGLRTIYLLKHREFNKNGTIKKMAPPRFMVFHKTGIDSSGVPKSREKGLPMSRVEFEDLLDFLLGKGIREIICGQLYGVILEDTQRELGKAAPKEFW